MCNRAYKNPIQITVNPDHANTCKFSKKINVIPEMQFGFNAKYLMNNKRGYRIFSNQF